MDEQTPNEPVFRANKRRKVFRKRNDVSDEVEDDSGVGEPQAAITNQRAPSDDDTVGAIRLQRRPHGRKHGIAFTSTEARKAAEDDGIEGRELVLAHRDEEQEAPGSDRFVRPTGRVAVTEDKHMTAYIDSKLAEVRSAAPPLGDLDRESPAQAAVPASNTEPLNFGAASASTGPNASLDERSFQAAQARSTRSYRRPTKRRAKPGRDQADIERDSMIDQIMQESQLPMYEQPAANPPGADSGDLDNDAATAEAFKANLIAEMEARNRRRAAPKAASKDAKAVTGPKLGGSRSQREKMKALEEAKSANTKK